MNFQDINWAAVLVVGLIAYIFWAILVPPKAIREQMRDDINRKKSKSLREYKRIVYSAIGINAVAYERGEITGYITSIKPAIVLFEGIHKGDYSETLYLNVLSDGNIIINKTEREAQQVYQKGDFGIASITMTEGMIQFRDILPNGVDPKNMHKLRFNFIPGYR